MTARYISTPHIKPFSSHETGFMLSLPSITGVFSPQMPVNSVPPLVRMKNSPAQNSSAPTSLFTHER